MYSADSVQGRILTLQLLQSGSGYTTVPTINLTQSGDGTAQAVATIITGAFTYPGRYLNDDGHISSYNFIQDRDYYQNFSYVVKSRQSVDSYRQALKDLWKKEKDFKNLIAWKDIFSRVEKATDSCEHVANVLERIRVKYYA